MSAPPPIARGHEHHSFWESLDVVASHDPDLLQYPDASTAPFDSDRAYPEYADSISPHSNPVYDAVRHLLRLLRRDEPHFGTASWNPLRGLIEPGMWVTIKPNLVADTVREGADLSALFTNMSVVRPLLDYVRKALRGEGRITLGDAPIQRTNWANLLQVSGMGRMVEVLNQRHGVPIELLDFRRDISIRNSLGTVIHRERRDGLDYVEVDLASSSTLMPIVAGAHRFRVSQYDPSALLRNHSAARNSYMIHRRALEADVVVNVPKLKLHKKAGITCSLKNLVGINCGKDWLPHYRVGDSETGSGDQYRTKSRLRELYTRLCDAVEVGSLAKRHAAAVLCKGIRGLMRLDGGDLSCEGNWHGNDTTWRMVHDLNLVLCYARADGRMSDRPQRRVLNVVDGIIGGERDSPLQPTAHPAGILMAGTNPLAVDLAAATVMGLDCAKVPLLRDAWNVPAGWSLPPRGARPDLVRILLQENGAADLLDLVHLADRVHLGFEPPPGWVNMLERPRTNDPRAHPIRG